MWHSLRCSIWEQYLIRALSKHLLKQVLLNGKGHWKEKNFYKTWISRWDHKQICCYSFVNIWYVGVYKDLSDISAWEILSIEKFSFFFGSLYSKRNIEPGKQSKLLPLICLVICRRKSKNCFRCFAGFKK